jgi:hypothetical protein
MSEWETNIGFFIAVIAFIEAPLFVLLDKFVGTVSFVLIFSALDVILLTIAVVVWAPLVTKGRAKKITTSEIKKRFPHIVNFSFDDERTQLTDHEWHIVGLVNTISATGNRWDAFEIILDSRCGTVNTTKSKFPNIP